MATNNENSAGDLPAGDEVPPAPRCPSTYHGEHCERDAGHPCGDISGHHRSEGGFWTDRVADGATPESEGGLTGASDVDETTPLQREFTALRNRGFVAPEGTGASDVEAAPAASEPTCAELARLLPGDMDRAVAYARRLTAGGLVDDGTILSRSLLAAVAERDEALDMLAERDDEIDTLRARVAELEAQVAPRPTAVPSRWSALTQAQRRSVTGWLADRLSESRHEWDPESVEAYEALIELAEQAPAGWRVAALLARLRSIGEADMVAEVGIEEAIKRVEEAFPAPSPLDRVVAEVVAEHDRIASLGPWDPMEHWSAICTEVDSAAIGVPPARDRLIRVMGEALAGLLACDAAKGGNRG